MFNPSNVRRSRARRAASAAVLLVAGLTLGTVSVAVPTAAVSAAPASDVVGLKYGARGDHVVAVQRALNRVGIGVKYGVDGYFGSATTASVKALQRYKGLPMTGVIDTATARALGFSVAPAPVATPTAAAAPVAPTAAQTATAVDGLAPGATGAAVAKLQRALTTFGWPLVADGVYGARTQAAVRAVQRANGIAATGVVDARTAQLLRYAAASGAAPVAAAAAPAAAASPSTPAGSTAAGFAGYDERGARVVALQNALIRAGITTGGFADGVFGSRTLNALLTFQRSRGLPAHGKVDAATASALGLVATDPPASPASTIAVALEAKPLQGPCYYGDTWYAARTVGRVHLGVDIGAREGNELYAVATGTVTKIYTTERDPLTGNGLRIARADGTYFFYGHLSALAAGIAVGTPVTAGQLVGYVGKTGNTAVSHLHLEVHPGGGSAVNPYPIVKAIGAC